MKKIIIDIDTKKSLLSRKMYLDTVLYRLSISYLLLKLKILNPPLLFKNSLIPNFKTFFKAIILKTVC